MSFLSVPSIYASPWFANRGEKRKNPLGKYARIRGEISDYRPRSIFEEPTEEPPPIFKESPPSPKPILEEPILKWELPQDDIILVPEPTKEVPKVVVAKQTMPLYMLWELMINTFIIIVSNLQPPTDSVPCYLTKGSILGANLVLVAIIALKWCYVRPCDNWLFLFVNVCVSASVILDLANQKKVSMALVMGTMAIATLRGLIDVFLSIRDLCKKE